MARNLMKHTIYKWGSNILSIHGILGPPKSLYQPKKLDFSWKNNILKNNFFYTFPNLNYVLLQVLLYPFTSLLAEFGGCLGLFLGFSFVTISDGMKALAMWLKKYIRLFDHQIIPWCLELSRTHQNIVNLGCMYLLVLLFKYISHPYLHVYKKS